MESTRKAFAPGVDLPLEGEDGMVRHYGDPAAEYGFVRGAVGVVERRDLAQLKMFGRDPVRMLNGLITNDLGRASGSQAVYGAVLTPKGRVITDLRVMKTSDDPP